MEHLITIPDILDNPHYVLKSGHYIEVKVIWSSEQEKRYCFIFSDKVGRYIGGVTKQYDHNSENVYQKLKNQTNFFKIKPEKIETVETLAWRVLRKQCKQILLSSSTLNLEKLKDTQEIPAYLPFEFTLLEDIDAQPEGCIVDIIGNVISYSPVLTSAKGDTKYQTVKLGSSRSTKDAFKREIACFGHCIGNICSKNVVVALLNVKVGEFERSAGKNKTLQTTGHTIIMKISREDFSRLPPAYHEAKFVLDLFPKKREFATTPGRRSSRLSTSTLIAKEENISGQPETTGTASVECTIESLFEVFTSASTGPSSARTESFVGTVETPNISENFTTCQSSSLKRSVSTSDEESIEPKRHCGNSAVSTCSTCQTEDDEFTIPNKTYDFVDNYERFHVVVNHVKEFMDTGKNCYRMRSKPRGRALIINNYHYPYKEGDYDQKHRLGSLRDVDNLNDLLQGLGFEVETKSDVATKELEGILTNFKNKFTDEMDACFVTILSHGANDLVEMVDEVCVELPNDIIHQFDRNAFRIMADKPKIFLVQTCQDIPRDIDITQAMPDRSADLDLENILVVKATIPGMPAVRDPYLGSPFVYVFVDTVMEYACKMHLVKILEAVRSRLKNVIRNKKTKLHCQWTPHGFNKLLFFNPGLNNLNEIC